MGERFKRLFGRCWRDGLGFALFLAWVYCTLFGCGLSVPAWELLGAPTSYELERIWMFSGLAEAAGGVVGLVVLAVPRLRRLVLGTGVAARPAVGARGAGCAQASAAVGSSGSVAGPGSADETGVAGGAGAAGLLAGMRDGRALAWGALLFSVLGSFVIWASWLERSVWFWRLHWLGGLLAGVAIALFTIVWGRRLSSLDESRIEFAVPLAFVMAFALYLVLLFLELPSVVDLVIAIAIGVGSLGALRAARAADASADVGEGLRGATGASSACEPVDLRGAWRDLLSFGALSFILWVQVAYFRVISSPDVLGNRFTHYLYPFLAACLISVVVFVVCIRMSRYLNITLAYRWSLPLFLISYIPMAISYADERLRMVAYAINFLGMFGVQFGCWIGASKHVRRMRRGALGTFSCYAVGEGLGVLVGCLIGLSAVGLGGRSLTVLSFVLLGVAQMMAMIVGFNPTWVFYRTRGFAPRPACAGGEPASAAAEAPGAAAEAAGPVESLDEADALGELFQRAAHQLQQTYALTNRETEVAALLLAGRSRPAIRDELFISLNTVGVHARNIFAKCNVHSQQELIALVYADRH